MKTGTKSAMADNRHDFDYVIIGSGFGGSVSALRLSEKGYRVLVLEKGLWKKGEDFPKSNWNLKRWFWKPALKFFGIFQMTFFRNVTVVSGAGVGGGSLVYANTLPVPKSPFFKAASWAHLADWEKELKPHYATALRMLGAAPNPYLGTGDRILREIGEETGRSRHFHPTHVAVYFGKPDETVSDPYFSGHGPDRTGCNFCGGCMTGCRFGAKNTLDKNYLYFAQKYGAEIRADSTVTDVQPLGTADGSGGYRIVYRRSTTWFPMKKEVTAAGVIFSAGVLGTVALLLKLRKKSLPKISSVLGDHVRTNNESILGVTSADSSREFSRGVAIGSILDLDENSHVEPVRYASGSGFWRLLLFPAATGRNVIIRLFKVVANFLQSPLQYLRVLVVRDWARSTQILLFMQTLDSTLRFSRGLFGMKSRVSTGEKPTPFIPLSHQLAERFADKAGGKVFNLNTETLLAIPTTAHILGGCVMGENSAEGVIDRDHHLFGYENMLVCDGSAISANVGVNPSLTITALTERAMQKIPVRKKIEAIRYLKAIGSGAKAVPARKKPKRK